MSVQAWNTLILESSKGASLPSLLTALLGLQTMRQIAKEKGLGAKGFRVEKATSKQLAPLLAKEATTNEGLREELASALDRIREQAPGSGAKQAAQQGAKRSSDFAALDPAQVKALELRLRKAEKKGQREAESAKKARASRQESLDALAAQRSMEAGLRRDLKRLAKECETWKERVLQSESGESGRDLDDADAEERKWMEVRERIADLEELDRAHRVSEAEHLSRIRELEAVVQELDALLPRGKRERLKQFQKSQVAQRAASSLLPVYGREFLDALERIAEADQHRIHTALAQVILGGLEQPGLRVKNLKGRGALLSIRAGLHYRIYFTRTGDKIYLHHVGTREEQDTFLRRWRG